jgi:hypothetical protein
MVTALTKHINFAAFSKGYSTIDNENILFASLITITHTHTHTHTIQYIARCHNFLSKVIQDFRLNIILHHLLCLYFVKHISVIFILN